MALINVTDQDFEKTVMDGGIVFVDAWAEWCGPCKRFGPIFEKVADKHDDAIFAKLDTDANQATAMALQIQSIPTLMVFREGIMVFRNSGILPESALDDLYRQVSELDMDDVRRQIAEKNKSAE